MRRVLAHNLSTRYADAPAELVHFDQNALLFAEPGDIVVARRTPDATHRRFLEEIGAVRKDIAVMASAQSLESTSGPFSIFEDPALISALASQLKSAGGEWRLDTYRYTEHECRFAEQLDLHAVGYPLELAQFGTKSGFRDLAAVARIPVPPGFAHLRSPFDVGIAAARLLLFRANSVVVKQDDAEAGLSMHRIDRRAMRSSLSDPNALLPHPGVLSEIKPAYVVERWIEDVVSSPSIACEIYENGGVALRSVHEQRFFGDRMSYRGCRSAHWLPAPVVGAVSEHAVALAEALAGHGVRGHVAFDAIVTADKVYMIEANLRRIQSSYAHQLANRLRADAPPYIGIRIDKPTWRGMAPARLLDRLGSARYAPPRGTGVVPYDLGMFATHGRASFLCIGNDPTDAESFRRVIERM